MIHLLFDSSSSGSLNVVLRDLGLEKKARVISFWEQFSIGPVCQIQEEHGMEERFEWVADKLNQSYDDIQTYTQYFQKAIRQLQSIPAGESIYVWAADNAHEQTGLRFVVHLLKDRPNDIIPIFTTAEHQALKLKVNYTIIRTGEISPEYLQLIYEQHHGTYLTDHEREALEKEWLELAESHETLRIWRNGKIHNVSEDYYDMFIIQKAKKLHREQNTKDFMKSARLIGEVLGHLEQSVGDEFLEYRLRKLIEQGIFEVEGSLVAMRFYSVRLKEKPELHS